MSGQQLLCIHNVLDSASSSAHLHLSEPKRLLFVCSSTQVPLRPTTPTTTTTTTIAITLGILGQGSGLGVRVRLSINVGVLCQSSLRSVVTCVL